MKLVLCEGPDDVAVVQGLCKASGLSGLTVEQFGGKDLGGKDNMRPCLCELPKRPEFAR